MASENADRDGLFTRRNALAAIAGAGTVSVAGCSALGLGSDGLDGEINASGSNTVAPITQAAAESFQDAHGARVAVDPQGTGAGFQEFCRANSDVQSASRYITDEEIDLCSDNDVDYENFTIGRDGLAVGVNANADWIDEITLSELNQIWDFGSDVEQWSDVRDEWPDEDIFLHGRDDASGTFDYFTREINGEMARIRDDYSATSQTDEIWGAVADNEYALGWGGLGHLSEQKDAGADLKTVAVESDQEPGSFYHPTEENIESGAYTPLARPLFIFLNLATLEEKPKLIGTFARHYFNGQRDFARSVGFFATPEAQVTQNHDEFEAVLNTLGIDATELDEKRED